MMSREVLTERLLEAEIALHKLLTGRSTVSLSHGDSAGNKPELSILTGEY